MHALLSHKNVLPNSCIMCTCSSSCHGKVIFLELSVVYLTYYSFKSLPGVQHHLSTRLVPFLTMSALYKYHLVLVHRQIPSWGITRTGIVDRGCGAPSAPVSASSSSLTTARRKQRRSLKRNLCITLSPTPSLWKVNLRECTLYNDINNHSVWLMLSLSLLQVTFPNMSFRLRPKSC